MRAFLHPRTGAARFSRTRAGAARCGSPGFRSILRREVCEYYEALWAAIPPGLEPYRFEPRARFLRSRVSSGDRVLDLGCGEGRFAAELLRAGASVLAADVAEEPLRRARASVPGLETALIAPAGGWALADASFDVVWAGEVIGHVLDTSAWLSEVRRVLRPGGQLVLSTRALERAELLCLSLAPKSRMRRERFDPRSDDLRFYSAGSLRELLLDFGFEAIEVRLEGSLLDAARGERLLLAHARRGRR